MSLEPSVTGARATLDAYERMLARALGDLPAGAKAHTSVGEEAS